MEVIICISLKKTSKTTSQDSHTQKQRIKIQTLCIKFYSTIATPKCFIPQKCSKIYKTNHLLANITLSEDHGLLEYDTM